MSGTILGTGNIAGESTKFLPSKSVHSSRGDNDRQIVYIYNMSAGNTAKLGQKE